MFSAIAVLLLILVALVGSSAVIYVLTRIFNRVERLESRHSGADARRLEAELERLREEVDATSHTVDRLTERLDFTERLLSGRRNEP